MRRILFTIVYICAFADRADAQSAAKDTPAAERTRTVLLKAKVTFEFANTPLRDCLKELAAQAEMQHDRPVMWTYAAGVDPAQKVTYSCNGKSLDAVLDDLFKKPGLGYVVVSKDDDKRDGWVQVTAGGERGFTKATETVKKADTADDDEKVAAGKLAVAKELIETGKRASARPVLQLVAKKYPATKAGAEAKELLEKLDK